MIQLQAEAIGIHLLQKEATWETYEQDFKDAVKSLIPKGIKGMVFGDLYLEEHKKWTENICGELGIKGLFASMDELAELNLGGTAVGTGLNVLDGFGEKALSEVNRITGLEFRLAQNPFEATQGAGSILGAHRLFKIYFGVVSLFEHEPAIPQSRYTPYIVQRMHVAILSEFP